MPKVSQSRSTAHDVARLAGVSQAAVSRTFSPGGCVSAETRRKVMHAAEELGYRPNAIARSLITKQSNIIGVAVGHLTNPYFAAAIEELSKQLAGVDLRLLLFPASVETSIKQVLQYRIEALVMLSALPSEELVAECQVGDIPIIMFNRCSGKPHIPSIVGDNEAGGRMLAAYLLAGGHQRFAFISAGDESTASRDREAGFRSYLSEQGVELAYRESAEFSVEMAATAARRLLLHQDRPDAIFCANDHVAMTAMQVAQSEFGLEIGRELSIVGFDDVPQASWPGISLTTYSQPVSGMVERTLDVIARLRRHEIPEPVNVVPGDLIIRSSARRPHQPIRVP